PLRQEAYDQFAFGNFDAIKIEAEHIVRPVEKPWRPYLLVDILAVDKEAAKEFRGLGFKTIIRHLAMFYNPLKQDGPIILCSTENHKLRKVLKDSLGFDEKDYTKSPAAQRVQRVDLSRMDLFSPELRQYYSSIIDLLSQYQE